MEKDKITGIKIHPDCCGVDKPMYMGISRHSHHYTEKNNPHFDSTKVLSVDNFPTLIDTNSVIFKFYLALKEMKASGETDKLYTKHHQLH